MIPAHAGAGASTSAATAGRVAAMTQQVSNAEMAERAQDLFRRVQQLKEHL